MLTLMSSAKLNRSGAVVPRARLQVLDAVADEAGAGELRARPPRVEAEHPPQQGHGLRLAAAAHQGNSGMKTGHSAAIKLSNAENVTYILISY